MESARRVALLQAMLLELAGKGYEEASVVAARSVAGVSAEEFESEFDGKDDCLFAAYDHLTTEAIGRATAACDSEQEWPERVRAGLTALLVEVAAEPELARVLTRGFPSIRPSTYQRYVDLLSAFAAYMREGREYADAEEELPPEIELLAVGAAEAIIFAELDAGRAEGLPALGPQILFSILVPFLGPDRAADEMRNASAAL